MVCSWDVGERGRIDVLLVRQVRKCGTWVNRSATENFAAEYGGRIAARETVAGWRGKNAVKAVLAHPPGGGCASRWRLFS
jgi:hypothetical protein